MRCCSPFLTLSCYCERREWRIARTLDWRSTLRKPCTAHVTESLAGKYLIHGYISTTHTRTVLVGELPRPRCKELVKALFPFSTHSFRRFGTGVGAPLLFRRSLSPFTTRTPRLRYSITTSLDSEVEPSIYFWRKPMLAPE